MINLNTNIYQYSDFANIIEIPICTDASMLTKRRNIVCAGAVSMISNDIITEFYPDTTNDTGELLGIFLGIKLGHKIAIMYGLNKYHITIYSDNEYAIDCFTWMNKWIYNRDERGILYKSPNKKVKNIVANQNLISMIIRYCYENALSVTLMDIKAHLNLANSKNIYYAMEYFHKRNNAYINYDDMYRILVFNKYIDEYTKSKLSKLDINTIPRKVMTHNDTVPMCYYTIPPNYNTYISRY